MNKVLALGRALVVIVYTGWQIALLYIDTLINGKSIQRSYKHRRYWARNTMRIENIVIDEYRGKVDVPVALYVSNHRTLIDPAIQLAYINAHIIAKDTVGGIPVIGKGAEMTGIILVKRDKMGSRISALKTTRDLLSGGISVLVYPEGTVCVTQTTKRFKQGTFNIAAQLGIPVIPVAIEYPDRKDYWFEGSLSSQMIRQTGSWRTRAKLRIGDPIFNKDPSILLEMSKQWIDKNLLEMQKGWSNIFSDSQKIKPTSESS